MATKINDFMKELTEATGLYGEELFDFIKSKCIPKVEKDSSAWEPIKKFDSFYGNNAAALNYLIALGADENMQKLFKASSPEFRAAILASVARVERFEWTAPVHIYAPNMTEKERWEDRTYIGYWNGETKHYDF